jgi:hypothetical protein
MELHTINAETILEVIKANTTSKGGLFTIKSKKTQKDYTYKINRVEYKGKWYSHIFVETGYMLFLYLGFYSNGVIINKGKENNLPSAKAISYVLNCIDNNKLEYINTNVEFYHLGKCIKCGKTLTDSNSIKAGLGPYCRSQI